MSRELLLVDHGLPDDVHPRPLVEPRRAGGVLRVDSELDAALAPLPELAARAVQEREAQAAPAPEAADTDTRDPPRTGVLRIRDQGRRDLIPVPDDGPERRVEARTLEPPSLEALELIRYVAPLVLERFLARREERPRVPEIELPRLEPFRPPRLRRRGPPVHR